LHLVSTQFRYFYSPGGGFAVKIDIFSVYVNIKSVISSGSRDTRIIDSSIPNHGIKKIYWGLGSLIMS